MPGRLRRAVPRVGLPSSPFTFPLINSSGPAARQAMRARRRACSSFHLPTLMHFPPDGSIVSMTTLLRKPRRFSRIQNMDTPFALLRFIGRAMLNAVGAGIAGDLAVDVLPEVA